MRVLTVSSGYCRCRLCQPQGISSARVGRMDGDHPRPRRSRARRWRWRQSRFDTPSPTDGGPRRPSSTPSVAPMAALLHPASRRAAWTLASSSSHRCGCELVDSAAHWRWVPKPRVVHGFVVPRHAERRSHGVSAPSPQGPQSGGGSMNKMHPGRGAFCGGGVSLNPKDVRRPA